MKRFGVLAVAAAAVLAMASPAQARVLDNIQIKFGVSGVLPNESARTSIGGDVNISDEYVPSLQVEYFFSDHVSAELLCCVATHEVHAVNTVAGDINLGEVSHFPPTVTLKYHFTNLGRFQPYVGAGVNYTTFYDDKLPSGGPVTSIKYSDSWGGALQAGFDYRLNDHWSVGADVRRIWISTDVDMQTTLGPVRANVDIDPWVVTTSIGYRF